MHILILPMYYPEPGAPAHRGYMFYEQARQLAQSGCRVGLVYAEQRLPKEFTLKTFCQESHFQISQEDEGGFTTLRMHAWNPKLSTRIGGLIWARLMLHLVRNYIKRCGKPDIIHAHFGTWAGYAARLAYKRYGIPYVVTEHASSIGSLQVTPSQTATLKAAYQEAKAIICVGTQLKESLLKLQLAVPEKLIVMPNFVDISTFDLAHRPTRKEKQFTWVSIGNLVKIKGFDLLIEAFGKSFAHLPHVSLVIAGSGPEKEALKARIEALHLEKQVTLAGHLSRNEVAHLLAGADAFALASFIETFGIVFIEAMATGMPVVGTHCGGPTDIVAPQCGLLVPPRNVEALSNAMKQLYDNYEQFDKEQIRRSVVARFDFAQAAERLMELYSTTINQPKQ